MASRIDRLPRIWRLLAGGIAGGFAGGLVAGLGARGAMRLIGLAAGEEAQSTAPTGEIVGRFTWLGTLGLLEFAVIVGIVAGLYYVLRQAASRCKNRRHGSTSRYPTATLQV